MKVTLVFDKTSRSLQIRSTSNSSSYLHNVIKQVSRTRKLEFQFHKPRPVYHHE
jgi:hypothetical protein